MSDIEMTEDEFDKQFTVIESVEDGSYHAKVPDGVPVERVWTAVDGDDGGIYLLPGYHIVNKVNYVITKEPWPHENITVAWWVPEGPTMTDKCRICHLEIGQDDSRTWIDSTGGDVCMDNDGIDGTHEPEEEDGAPREQWEATDPFQYAEPDTRDKHDPTL